VVKPVSVSLIGLKPALKPINKHFQNE